MIEYTRAIYLYRYIPTTTNYFVLVYSSYESMCYKVMTAVPSRHASVILWHLPATCRIGSTCSSDSTTVDHCHTVRTINASIHSCSARAKHFSQLHQFLFLTLVFIHFYRAMLAQSAVMRLLSSVRLSVRPSVRIRYRVQIRWNSLKIISRPNSLRSMCSLTPDMGDLVQREHPQN